MVSEIIFNLVLEDSCLRSAWNNKFLKNDALHNPLKQDKLFLLWTVNINKHDEVYREPDLRWNQRMKEGLPKFQKVEISSVTPSNLLKYGGMEDFNYISLTIKGTPTAFTRMNVNSTLFVALAVAC